MVVEICPEFLEALDVSGWSLKWQSESRGTNCGGWDICPECPMDTPHPQESALVMSNKEESSGEDPEPTEEITFLTWLGNTLAYSQRRWWKWFWRGYY